MNYSFQEWLSHKAHRLFDEAKKKTNEPEGGNILLPVSSESGVMQVTSNYEEDRPALHRFAVSAEDGVAQALMFVLMTPRSNLRDVWRFFPVILGVLKSMPKGDFDEEKFTTRLNDMLNNAVPPPDYTPRAKKGTKKDDFHPVPQGYAMTTVSGATPSNWKIRGITKIWKNATKIQDEVRNMISGNVDVVKLTDKLIDDIPGMDVVKAAFAVQILVGKLGCIDSHNLRIYTDYLYSTAQGKEGSERRALLQTIADMDPSQMVMGKDIGLPGQYSAAQIKKGELKKPGGVIPRALKAKSNKVTRGSKRSKSGQIDKIVRYVRALEMIENEMGIGTKELWDFWTNYVSQTTVDQGGGHSFNPRYGSGMKPEDLEKTKLGGDTTVPYIPKGQGSHHSHKAGEGERLKLKPSASSRAVGMAHRFDKLQPRDMIDPAIGIAQDPTGAGAHPFLDVLGTHGQKVHPLLYWAAQDPRMADYLGFGPEKRQELMDLLKHHGLTT